MRRLRYVPLLVLCGLSGCGEDPGPLVAEPPTGFITQRRHAYTVIRQRWSEPPAPPGGTFSVGPDHLLKDGEPFRIRGVVYVPGYPGHLPWDTEIAADLPEKLRNSIDRDLEQIAEMGANTVRLWGAPRYAYEAIARLGTLHFIQTLWIDPEAGDLHDPAFKASTRAYIRTVVDRIQSVFPGGSAPLVAYLVGNELSARTILATDAAHPALDRYEGSHVRTGAGLSPSEVFLAEMADYVKGYEEERYGVTHLVSYANQIYTADLIDTPFLDFRSHNVYPYDIPYVRPGTSAGSVTGTLLQGWVEELKARHPGVPLLVTETGLSVSPNAPHRGPPDYGYGGNTETEQAAGLLQALEDAATARGPSAGVVVHEFLDAWWKFGLEDSFTQDPDDVEEWFGLIRLVGY
ncbi:MAG TPA: hypothetical protein VLA43_03810 [Longimicrobiales bacterium]|nr:hypothetical protein [Longimicrobiales bacterium]